MNNGDHHRQIGNRYVAVRHPLSRYALERYIPLETFIGYRLTCSECDRPFRCFRPDETLCGCCK